MKPKNRSSDDRHEELVAYLDGELPPEECRRIEERLSNDGDYRSLLQGLDDVWQALDELPQASVDESFTRTTIEMVTIAAQEDLATQTAALPARRRRQKLLVGVVVAAAVLVGFVAARLFWPDPNRELLAELPIIQQVDVYTQFRDVDFLRRLRKSAETRALEENFPELEEKVAEWREVTQESPVQRRSRIEKMAPDQRAALLTRSNRFFQQLTAAERERIRDLHAEILAQNDARDLQATMLAFGNWLQGRTPGERADLRERPADERIQRIADLVRRDQWRFLRELSPEDSAVIRQVALALFEERRPYVERLFEMRGEKDIERHIERYRATLVQFVAHRALESDHERDEMLDRFTRDLSKPIRHRLEDMHPEHAARFVRRWVRQAFRGDVTPKDLEHYFTNELSNAEREELLAMPADQMEEALYSRYVREKFNLREVPDDPDRGSRRPDKDRDRDSKRNGDRGERDGLDLKRKP